MQLKGRPRQVKQRVYKVTGPSSLNSNIEICIFAYAKGIDNRNQIIFFINNLLNKGLLFLMWK